MANPTWLDIKNLVAAQLGKTDGSTYTTKRETLLNQARRKFYSERQWSFLTKVATVSISSQLGTLPSDYNKLFPPLSVYTYTGTTKYEYTKVDFADIASYATDTYVYAIDIQNGQIKINQTTVSSITMEYTKIPADHPADNTEDSTSEDVQDITPIVYLGIAYWWKSSERNEDEFKVYMDLYREELQRLIRMENNLRPVVLFRPRRQYAYKGYVGPYAQ